MSLTGEDLSKLCSPSFLDGIEVAPVTELRIRRDACQRAELVLSYLRRVIQGEMDLVLAEMELRADGSRSDVGRLVEDLPSILAFSGPSTGEPTHVPVATMLAVGEVMDVQHDITLEELLVSVLSDEQGDQVLPGGLLPGANLCTFVGEELLASLTRLRDVEKILSGKRRSLHDHIDRIQGAIVDRYKSGAADPDSLLA